MTTTLRKWGNSTAVRIPNELLRKLDLNDGDKLEITIGSDNCIELRPARPKDFTNSELREHLDMLLSKVKGDRSPYEEIDFGIMGDELL